MPSRSRPLWSSLQVVGWTPAQPSALPDIKVSKNWPQIIHSNSTSPFWYCYILSKSFLNHILIHFGVPPFMEPPISTMTSPHHCQSAAFRASFRALAGSKRKAYSNSPASRRSFSLRLEKLPKTRNGGFALFSHVFFLVGLVLNKLSIRIPLPLKSTKLYNFFFLFFSPWFCFSRLQAVLALSFVAQHAEPAGWNLAHQWKLTEQRTGAIGHWEYSTKPDLGQRGIGWKSFRCFFNFLFGVFHTFPPVVIPVVHEAF